MEIDIKHELPAGQAELDGDDEPIRRSTRVCAKKAAEKIKGGDNENTSTMCERVKLITPSSKRQASAARSAAQAQLGGEATKKRKLAKDCQLDPTDSSFAIQLTENGDVVVLSDGSEVSSLNEQDLDFLRENYKKAAAAELTEEQRLQRSIMIAKLQAELRAEEANLVFLKKIRLSQLLHANKLSSTNQTQAILRPSAAVGSTIGSRGNQLPSLTNKSALNTLNPPKQHSTPVQSRALNATTQERNVPQNLTKPPAEPQKPVDTQTPEQKQAAAKYALRKQLEKTLLQIPPPKPPPPEMNFVPSPNQIDFILMTGLDYIVQRLHEQQSRRAAKKGIATAEGDAAEEAAKMKLKEVVRKSDALPPAPNECAQCETDFTTLWRRGEAKPGDGKDPIKNAIMCDACVRVNQKKALKAEHTSRLKQAFVKALQQEQEIEAQIKAGNFNFPLLQQAEARPSSRSLQQASSAQRAVKPNIAPQQQQRLPSSSHGSNALASQLTPQAMASMQAQLMAVAAAGLWPGSAANPALLAAAARYPQTTTPQLTASQQQMLKQMQMHTNAQQLEIQRKLLEQLTKSGAHGMKR